MAKTTSKKAATKGASSSGTGSSGSKGATAKKAAAGSKSGGANSSNSSASRPAAKSAQTRSSSSSKGSQNSGFEQAGFDKLFLESLKDVYGAEKQLLKALPKMRKGATSPELQTAFEEHTAVTQEQVSRLEQVFELLGQKAKAKKCEAMDGLVREAEEMISETQKGSMTRDVALIMAAQKVEHYEIASYGTLATLASIMQEGQIKELLGQTLEEEKQTDELLTQLAENNINQQAAQRESMGGQEMED